MGSPYGFMADPTRASRLSPNPSPPVLYSYARHRRSTGNLSAEHDPEWSRTIVSSMSGWCRSVGPQGHKRCHYRESNPNSLPQYTPKLSAAITRDCESRPTVLNDSDTFAAIELPNNKCLTTCKPRVHSPDLQTVTWPKPPRGTCQNRTDVTNLRNSGVTTTPKCLKLLPASPAEPSVFPYRCYEPDTSRICMGSADHSGNPMRDSSGNAPSVCHRHNQLHRVTYQSDWLMQTR